MGRLPKVVQLPDGNVSARITMPASLWRCAVEIGNGLGIQASAPGHVGMKLILDQVASLLESGDASFLGAALFQQAVDRVRGSNLGVLARNSMDIDISKLHRSPKMKSGFVGVYVAGGGFRAIGRDKSGAAKVIATCKTAEEAAHKRWLYYTQNNLPYGEIEEEMERWRRNSEMGAAGLNDDELIRTINQHLEITGRWNEVYGPGTCSVLPGKTKPEAPKLPSTGLAGFDEYPEGIE